MTPGQRLVDALTRSGWTAHGNAPDAYARMQWRNESGTVVVPLDPSAPEHDELFDAAVATLGAIADRGLSAQRALDRLTDAGVIL